MGKRLFFVFSLLQLASIVMFNACSGNQNKKTDAPKYEIIVSWPVFGGIFTVEAGGETFFDSTEAYEGETITLTAISESRYFFGGFDLYPIQELNGEGNIWTFTMPGEAVTVTAFFPTEDEPSFTVTVTQPAEGGTFTVAGCCGEANYGNIEAVETETLTLTAIPDSGFEFNGFTVDPVQELSGEGNIWEFTMPAEAVTVTASFTDFL